MLLQIVNGKHKQATFVLLHLTGPAVVFADQLIGLRRFIDDVVKAKMLSGLPLSSIRHVSSSSSQLRKRITEF